MKNLKKVLSVILTVAMLISSFAAISVSAAGYGDVDETNSYYKAIQVLSGLDVVKGDEAGNFNPTSDIKRSEMVTLVCRAKGEESVAQAAGGVFFDDVSADHWAAGYIAWAVNSGIVNGVGDNKFDPDAPVKFQDAVVMVLRALGYERIAQRDENGGYPTGYLKVASQKGVLAGASFDGAKAATREVVAQVIYNALTTPLVDVSYYAPDPDDDEYVVFDGKNDTDLRTLLTYTNEIYKVKASVKNTAKTDKTLIKDADAPKVELKLESAYSYAWSEVLDGSYKKGDSIKPYVGDTDVADYLGYTVEAYIAENEDDEWELLAVAVDTKATDSLTITENFEDYKEGTFEYYEDEDDLKTTKLDLADEDDLVIYYNGASIDQDDIEAMTGKTDSAAIKELLVNKANELTFMGPKNDVYNTIFVVDYDYRQVDDVKADREYIKFKNGKGSLNLNAEDREDETFVYNLYDAEGNAITLEEVQEGDIFNIVAPYGALSEVPYMDIYVTNDTVTGSVTEKVSATKYVIDGKIYEINAGVSIKTGDEGIFYLTIDGLVFAADASSLASKNYSFIAAYGKDTSFNVNTHQLKLFTTEGLAIYDVAATLRVYDVFDSEYTYKTYKQNDKSQDAFFAGIAALIEADSEADAKANLKDRMVTFKLNANNEISELRFAATGEEFAVDKVDAKYNDDLQIFGGYDLDDSSILFVAPVTKNAENKWIVDEEDLDIATFASIDEDDEFKGTYLFSFEDDETLGAAIITKEIDSSLKLSHLAIVKTVSTGLDADGSSVAKYTFVQSGETLTKAVDYDATVAAMTIGDVFRYAVNADDEINKAEIILDMAEDASSKSFKDLYAYSDLDTNDIAIVYGKVTKVDGDKLTIDGAVDLTARMNETEGNTYAQFDYARFASSKPSNAVKALVGYGDILESYEKHTYEVVAIVNENGRFEDIIQFYKVG